MPEASAPEEAEGRIARKLHNSVPSCALMVKLNCPATPRPGVLPPEPGPQVAFGPALEVGGAPSGNLITAPRERFTATTSLLNSRLFSDESLAINPTLTARSTRPLELA